MAKTIFYGNLAGSTDAVRMPQKAYQNGLLKAHPANTGNVYIGWRLPAGRWRRVPAGRAGRPERVVVHHGRRDRLPGIRHRSVLERTGDG
jgi:hypothetical protein